MSSNPFMDVYSIEELEVLQQDNQSERDRLRIEAKQIAAAIEAQQPPAPPPGPGDAVASAPRAAVSADARMG